MEHIIKIAVVAGNHKEFRSFVDSCYNKDLYHYISHKNDCLGHHFVDMILYGTWYERQDIDFIREYLEYKIKFNYHINNNIIHD